MQTRQYLLKVATPELVQFISELPTRTEKLHLVPLFCKFGAPAEFTTALQETVIEDLLYCRVEKEQVSCLSSLLYFCQEADLPLVAALTSLFTKVAPGTDLSQLNDVDLMRFSKVFLKLKPCATDALVKVHMDRMKQLPFEERVSRELISQAGDFKQAYCELLLKVKFIGEPADHETILDRIELSNLILDNLSPGLPFLSSLYFTVLVRHTSLFFFRTRHLLTVLNLLSNTKFRSERDFWLKTEDYIMR